MKQSDAPLSEILLPSDKPVVDLLIIQPTPFCNLDCSYCYLPDRLNKNKLDPEILGKVIQNLLEEDLIEKSLSVVWHAGEPMVVKPDVFAQYLEKIKSLLPPGISVNHSIQTNGTLFDQSWCDLIKKFNIRMGVSIDGPDFIHDQKRVTRSGKGTHRQIMEGIRLLQENKIDYHAIAVVSEGSLDYPDEIFRFFYENNFFLLGLNIEEVEGINTTSSINNGFTEQKVLVFLERLFEIYSKSDGKMKIREFDNAATSMLRDPRVLDITKLDVVSHQLSPLAIISVDYKGNFSTFSPELLGQNCEQYGNFIFGNVHFNRFKDVFHDSKFWEIHHEILHGIAKCKKECQYFPVCGGGPPSNKFYENGTFNSTETMYCRNAIQKPVDIVLRDLERKLNPVPQLASS